MDITIPLTEHEVELGEVVELIYLYGTMNFPSIRLFLD